MKSIAITGANGFVGKNLVQNLRQFSYAIYEITRSTPIAERDAYLKHADFIVYLAAANRPKEESDFKRTNVDLLTEMLNVVRENTKNPTILLSSSIQAEAENAYGKSKKQAEDVLKAFSAANGNLIYIYRFPNLFGKWCRPDYNSVIATFCHHIARGEAIQINDKNALLTLNYIDDVVFEIIRAIKGQPTIETGMPKVPNEYHATLGEITELLETFHNFRETKALPKLDEPFEKALYSTYLSYLPQDGFRYPLQMNTDKRGSFTEFLKTPDRGQVSVNVSKPGITKGNHWHNTKNEKFLVVSGKGVIRFRRPDTEEVTEYHVSGAKLEVVDIPVGYTHHIENIGDTDMVTIMWVNEIFDPENPDTFYLEV